MGMYTLTVSMEPDAPLGSNRFKWTVKLSRLLIEMGWAQDEASAKKAAQKCARSRIVNKIEGK